jgi:uncharacterized protein GlcG (DUF336 family)
MMMALAGLAQAESATVSVRQLAPPIALKAAQAALAACQRGGYQVAVAVTDRAGLVQVLLRDRFAGAHTIEAATRKAWSSASFRLSTSDLAGETATGKPMAGLRELPMVLAVGGGLPIEADGSLLGAIGVSGAPGGDADAACARAGVQAIVEDIAF